jgi:SAM-dependent methyltransferase
MEQTSGTAAAPEAERLVEQVRERYARIAEGKDKGCCGPTCCAPAEQDIALGVGYSKTELAELPVEANLGLGCGAPIGFLEPAPGETVLDLGSGAGLDAFLAARRVGPTGRVIGVDMTPAMLEKARVNAEQLGLHQVEFREGRLEALPVQDGSIDAVTSNCVINLVPDKAAVFAEIARVLKPGGRLVISDIILDGRLPEAVEKDVYAWVGCIAGAEQRARYFEMVETAGLRSVEVLRDTDYVATLAASAPEDVKTTVRTLLDGAGVDEAQVIGKVRSVTFRARKP